MIINDSFLSFQVHLFVFLFPMSLHELWLLRSKSLSLLWNSFMCIYSKRGRV